MTAKDSVVRCTVCGRTEQVSFAWSLRNGWPTCHGYTMHLEKTEADVTAATNWAIADQKVPA